MKLTYKKEINKANLERAVNIFSLSFGGLFKKRITDIKTQKELYKNILLAEDVIYAYDEKGKVVGICGIGTKENVKKSVKVKYLTNLLGFKVGVVFASFFDKRKDASKDEIVISFIAVERRNRRRKIATNLIKYVMKYGDELGKKTVLVDNLIGNNPGNKLFEKFEFKLKETVDTKLYKKAFGIEFDKYIRLSRTIKN